MHALKLARLIGAMTVVASTPVLLAMAAHAQQSPPATEQTPGTRPEMRPAPNPNTTPGASDAQKPGTLQSQPGRTQAGAPSAGKETLVGLAVFGSDGQKVGEVKDVKAEPDGKVTEIHVRTGGFLGFGSKIVAIPAAKFNRSGQNVQLALTSADVVKMPVVVEKPS